MFSVLYSALAMVRMAMVLTVPSSGVPAVAVIRSRSRDSALPGRGFGHLMAKPPHKHPQLLQFLRIGTVVHPIDRGARRRLLLGVDLGQESRHFHIGQKHEVLDELVGLLHALDDHAKRLARLVELKAHLLRVEVDAASLEALVPQLRGKVTEHLQFLGPIAFACFEALLGFLVGEASVGVNHRAAKPPSHHLGLRGHLKHRTEREAVFVRAQRTQVVGEDFWQHGDGSVDQIDAGRTLHGFAVQTEPGVR